MMSDQLILMWIEKLAQVVFSDGFMAEGSTRGGLSRLLLVAKTQKS